MSQTQDNPDPRLEKMLRRWGAEEAAGRAAVGGAPKEPGAARPVAGPTVKPAWLAAARGLIAAAVVIGLGLLAVWGYQSRQDAETQSGRADDLQRQVKDLGHELATERASRDANVRQLENRIAALVLEANEALAAKRLTEAIAARAEAEANEARTQAAKTAAERDAKMAEVVRLSGELAKAKTELAQDANQKVGEALDRAQKAEAKLASASEELGRVQKMHQDAVAAAKKSQDQVAQEQGKYATALADFQQAYLAAAAPGESGLRALQVAVRRTQLIDRLAKLRPSADTPQKALLDKLDVVLTRMEMVEPGLFVQEDLFRSLLKTSGVLKQLDDGLDARTLPPPTKALFFEARFILSGAERVE